MKAKIKITEGMVEEATAALLVHYEQETGDDLGDLANIDLADTKKAVRVVLEAARDYTTRR